MRNRYVIAVCLFVMALVASLIAATQNSNAQSPTKEPAQQSSQPQTIPQAQSGSSSQAAPQSPSQPPQATPGASRPESSSPGQAGTAGSVQGRQAGHPVSVEDELQLTEEQKAKLQPILQQEMAQIEAVRSDSSLSADQKQARVAEIKQAGFPKIQAILTPEQQKKLADLQQRARQHDQGAGKEPSNPPKPPQ